MAGSSERHIVENGETSRRARHLKGADEPTARDPLRCRTVDASPFELYGSSFSREKSGDDVEQRRLAGAARADQRGDRALLDVERGAVDSPEPTESADDFPDREARRAHSSTISLLLPKMPCGRKSMSPMITSPITISRK